MKIAPSRNITYNCPLENRIYNVDIYSPTDIVTYLHDNIKGDTEKFIVNIGAGDGMSADPCYPLFKMGWPGVAIEGENNEEIFINLPQKEIQKLTGTFCTPLNIASILKSSETPEKFSFLKIDIDGYDGPVLQAILGAGYKPAVIQLELNQEITAVRLTEGAKL